MTRKDLAKEIYRMSKELGLIHNSSEALYVKRLLNGCGVAQATSKSELENRFNTLAGRI